MQFSKKKHFENQWPPNLQFETIFRDVHKYHISLR